MGGWIGKVGKDPHEHWAKCMFWTGNVPVRSAKAPVRRGRETMVFTFFWSYKLILGHTGPRGSGKPEGFDDTTNLGDSVLNAETQGRSAAEPQPKNGNQPRMNTDSKRLGLRLRLRSGICGLKIFLEMRDLET